MTPVAHTHRCAEQHGPEEQEPCDLLRPDEWDVQNETGEYLERHDRGERREQQGRDNTVDAQDQVGEPVESAGRDRTSPRD